MSALTEEILYNNKLARDKNFALHYVFFYLFVCLFCIVLFVCSLIFFVCLCTCVCGRKLKVII